MVELVTKSYTDVIFGLALEEGLLRQIGEELSGIVDIVRENPQYMTFLTSPQIAKADKISSIDAIFGGKVENTTKNFIKVLIGNGRAMYLSDIAKQYKKLQREHEGIVYIEAITSIAMDEEQKERLTTKLESTLGKRIELNNIVDASIIGGMKIRMGEKSLDASLKSRLKALHSELIK